MWIEFIWLKLVPAAKMLMRFRFHETWRNQFLLSFHDRFWMVDSQSEFTC